jgi:hypothetical protein
MIESVETAVRYWKKLDSVKDVCTATEKAMIITMGEIVAALKQTSDRLEVVEHAYMEIVRLSQPIEKK